MLAWFARPWTLRRGAAALTILCIAAWGLGLAHLLLHAATHPDIEIVRGHDNSYYYASAHSIWFDGDLDFENEIARFLPEHLDRHTPTGRVANKYGVGMPLMSGPAMLAARAIGWDGLGRGAQALYMLWNMALGLLGVFIVGVVTMRASISLAKPMEAEGGAGAGILAVSAGFIGSCALYYILIRSSMAHAAAIFCYSLILFGWERRYISDRPSPAWPALMGLGVGLAASVRMQDAPLGLLFVVSEALRFWKAKSEIGEYEEKSSIAPSALACMAFGALALIGLAPQLIYQKLLWGNWLVNAYATLEGERFYWLRPQLAGLLFSTRNSLLFFHPLMALGAVVLIISSINLKRINWALPLLLVVLVNIYINASWWAWGMGHSFGARGLLNCWPFFVVGLMAIFSDSTAWTKKARVILALTVMLALLWSTLMMFLYYFEMIPHDGSGFSPVSIPGRLYEMLFILDDKIGL